MRALIVLLLLLATGCAHHVSLDAPDMVPVQADYQIGAGDVVNINVWRNPEVSLMSGAAGRKNYHAIGGGLAGRRENFHGAGARYRNARANTYSSRW
jgi:hypothetical protein